MPTRVYWLDDGDDTLVLSYEDAWTWADMLEADRKLGEILDTLDRQVYVLGDYSPSERLQGSPVEARKMINKTVVTTHPNIRRVGVVSLPAGLRSMLVIYNRIFVASGKTMLSFNTMDEARQWLDEHPLDE